MGRISTEKLAKIWGLDKPKKKRKRHWIIRTLDSKGTILKEKGKILFFKTPDEARRHIEEKCGNSPYLTVKLWRSS